MMLQGPLIGLPVNLATISVSHKETKTERRTNTRARVHTQTHTHEDVAVPPSRLGGLG